MRLTDALIGLLAAMSVFVAAVFWQGDVLSWWGPYLPLGFGLTALLVMSWRRLAAPKGVVVGLPSEQVGHELREGLDEAGYVVLRCGGPTSRPCPVLEGRPCPVHWNPMAAVIFEVDGYAGPEPPCRLGLGVPALTVEEASAEGAQVVDGEGSVGWQRGTTELVRTLDVLLTPELADF